MFQTAILTITEASTKFSIRADYGSTREELLDTTLGGRAGEASNPDPYAPSHTSPPLLSTPIPLPVSASFQNRADG